MTCPICHKSLPAMPHQGDLQIHACTHGHTVLTYPGDVIATGQPSDWTMDFAATLKSGGCRLKPSMV